MNNSTRKRLYVVRKENEGFGGAENVAKRFKHAFNDRFDVAMIYAGCKLEGHCFSGQRGPGWLKSMLFADSVNKFLSSRKHSVTFSMSRGVPGSVFRVGDGIHAKWLERRKIGLVRRVFNPTHLITPFLERKSITYSNWVVPNSHLVASEIESSYQAEVSRMKVIHNGFAADRFRFANDSRRRELKECHKLPHDSLHLFFCANGWERKGLAWCIKLIGQLRKHNVQAHLWVAGKGNPKKYSKLACDCKSLEHTTFLGSIENVEIWFQMADLFVLPTLYDPFSNTCLEALASGCPVITTKSNGASECINNVNGLKINHPDDILDKSVIAWITDVQSIDRINISQSVSNRTIEHETSEYIKLLKAPL